MTRVRIVRLIVAALTLVGPAAATSPAADTWRVATSPHFTIYSQEPAATLQVFAEKLELFDAALRHLFPAPGDTPPAAQRLTIYALDNALAVQRVMGQPYSGAQGVYRPSIEGSIALTARGKAGTWEPGTLIVLLHEYTHHYMLTNFPVAYPIWFREGFAEFTDTAEFGSDGSVTIGAPGAARGFEARYGDQLSMSSMLADDVSALSPIQAYLLYGRGWALTHLLYFDRARDGQMSRYIRLINGGTKPADAAEQAFGGPRLLMFDLERYLRSSSFRTLILRPAVLNPGKVSVDELPPSESAIIPVRLQSRYGVDRADALRLVSLARQAAAPFPDAPGTLCSLAEAEDDARNFAEADRAADRLLALNPASGCGLLYKGRIAMDEATERKAAADDPAWKTARDWLVRANRADVENPLPMYLYYLSFERAHAPPTRNAADALLGAALRAPQDEGVRVAATAELLRRHETVAARSMLGPVANGTHSERGNFLGGIYRRIGQEPDEQVASALVAGPPAKHKPAAG